MMENIRNLRINKRGTSLAVQWLGPHLPMQGVQVQYLVRELRFHMPCSRNIYIYIKFYTLNRVEEDIYIYIYIYIYI